MLSTCPFNRYFALASLAPIHLLVLQPGLLLELHCFVYGGINVETLYTGYFLARGSLVVEIGLLR